jgi:hypothetical protein
MSPSFSLPQPSHIFFFTFVSFFSLSLIHFFSPSNFFRWHLQQLSLIFTVWRKIRKAQTCKRKRQERRKEFSNLTKHWLFELTKKKFSPNTNRNLNRQINQFGTTKKVFSCDVFFS